MANLESVTIVAWINKLKLVKMKQIINDFINSIDTKLYSRIRASKGDAECRRYLKEHLQKQLLLHNVGGSLSSNNKTRLIEWKELNLLPIRVQNILIMIYEYNYKNDIVIYLEDLKWQEFKRYRQAGKWSWAKFQDMRGY